MMGRFCDMSFLTVIWCAKHFHGMYFQRINHKKIYKKFMKTLFLKIWHFLSHFLFIFTSLLFTIVCTNKSFKQRMNIRMFKWTFSFKFDKTFHLYLDLKLDTNGFCKFYIDYIISWNNIMPNFCYNVHHWGTCFLNTDHMKILYNLVLPHSSLSDTRLTFALRSRKKIYFC